MKYLLLFLVVLSGCSTTRKVVYEVTSNPGGIVVEVNGAQVCNTTPCEFWVGCRQKWAIEGWYTTSGGYSVKGVPKQASEKILYTDSKTIDPCQVDEDSKGQVFFNLELKPVNPTIPIEIR